MKKHSSSLNTYIILLTILVIAVFGFVGGVYSLGRDFKNQSEVVAANKANVSELSSAQTGLSTAKKDVAQYSSLNSIAKAIVPQDKDQAETVRELTKIASQNSIKLTTISFPSSTLGSRVTTTTSSGTPTASSTDLSQLTPVKGMSGVYNLQITISNNPKNTVTYNQLNAFLSDLENNRRTAAVSSINIVPNSKDPSRLVFTLVINTYIKPA